MMNEENIVVRRSVSFNTMSIHFAPRIDTYNAAGEHLNEMGIVGQVSIDCCHMPDELRASVEQWVREAYLDQEATDELRQLPMPSDL